MNLQSEIVEKVRNSVVGVGYMECDPREFGRQASEKIAGGGKTERPPITFCGSGFLVSQNLALTNRHVIKALIATGVPKEHWVIEFVTNAGGSWTQSVRFNLNAGIFGHDESKDREDPRGHGDVGFVGFKMPAPEECVAEFGSLEAIKVGQEVVLCGYVLGSDLLSNMDAGIERFGSVVHRGMISAIDPNDRTSPRDIRKILTDVSTGGGFSGSPVCIADTGLVVGLHYAGTRTRTIGFAMPIDRERADGWISAFERVRNEPSGRIDLDVNSSGDIIALPP